MPSIVVGARSYPCSDVVTIGRGNTCTIVLAWTGGAAGYIARLQAQITVDDAGVMFRELSDDGSYINDQWLCGRTVALADGDRIRIGVHELVFRAV